MKVRLLHNFLKVYILGVFELATESPLIHDGSQTTASADMSNTGGLDGPSGSGQFLAVVVSGPRAVAVATAGVAVYGILQNKPKSGEAADVGIVGVTKAVAGAAVTSPQLLQTDANGRLIPATSTLHRVAMAIESAAATGVIFTVALVPGFAGTAT